MIVQRDLQKAVQKMARVMPVISLTGPRQSGKTTLAKLCFPDYHYVNLELPEARQFAINDPQHFLDQFKKGVIIDEAQYAPQLFSYIQDKTDREQTLGKFILTGSQNFLLAEKVSQSLAGRVAIFHLLPLSFNELKKTRTSFNNFERLMLKGFYPRLYDKKIPTGAFYSSYIQSYLERDVRLLTNVQNLGNFQRFLSICAGRTGQVLNYSAIGHEIGIDYKTAINWLSVLQSSFIVFLTQPYYKNYNKRIIKAPKLYFYDTGLASYLLGIENEKQLSTHYHRGALFENMIISDIIKNNFNAGQRILPYYWRDNIGNEIDLIVEFKGQLNAIEIKASKTFNTDYFKGLNFFRSISNDRNLKTMVIYGGKEHYKTKNGQCLPWHETNI